MPTKKDFDVLLLDIEMAGMDGVELAKTIRRDNDAVQIIFVTGPIGRLTGRSGGCPPRGRRRWQIDIS